ncbi:hypothetical protein ACKUB1_05695 [Methanospirillum stamsii]|uniref:Uncharacterized protein n=1 Tax=Methanospirillum stamsii TaxID=1277351 RepID=A0A2V2MXW6_9EURY|nr:hypothetical protein [Methanospirillum stamsii]PWR71090.1 hypothetical protein DLD82_14425 [Methanospirillum stamsii]
MRSIRGITAIIFCFVFLCIASLTGAEETDYSEYTDLSSVSEDWGEQEYGMSDNFDLEDLLGEELISNIIQFLLRLFLSLFSGSMY